MSEILTSSATSYSSFDSSKLSSVLMKVRFYKNTRHFDQAKELLEKVLPDLENAYGNNDVVVAKVLKKLGGICNILKKPDEAKERLERALSILESCPIEDSLEVASKRSNALRDPDKQKEDLQQELDIQEKECSIGHFQAVRILVSVANLCGVNKGKKELLEWALLIQEKYCSKDPMVAKTLSSLADVCGALGDPHKKKELLERSLSILMNEYYKNYRSDVLFDLNIAFRELGETYGVLKDYREQKKLFERALLIQEKHYSEDNYEIAKILVPLGIAYGSSEEPHTEKKIKAEALFERVLFILEKCQNKNDVEAARILINLGDAYGALGDLHKRKELVERALPIFEKKYGKEEGVHMPHLLEKLADVNAALKESFNLE